MDILASRGLNFNGRLNHTIWGYKNFCVQKWRLGAMWLKLEKMALERQNGAQSKAHGLKKRGENIAGCGVDKVPIVGVYKV